MTGDDEKALTWSVEVLGLKVNQTDPNILKQYLADYLSKLIHTDFNKLIAILYRIDVSQKKVQEGLETKRGQVAPGWVLAELIIDRQKQKLKFREKYS